MEPEIIPLDPLGNGQRNQPTEIKGLDDFTNHGSKIELNSKKAIINDFMTVGILGFGDYGKALATRCDTVGMPYFVGSRTPSRKKVANILVDLLSYKEVIAKSDVIVLAMKAKNYDKVIPGLSDDLIGKIVVDISNASTMHDSCNAINLANMLPSSRIIKAFNTVSAWSMSNDIYGASRNVYVCGDDADSRKTVMQLVQELGFTPVERGRLRAAEVLEKMPLQLFPAWRTAAYMTLGLFILLLSYYLLAEFLYEDAAKVVRHLALYHMNRVICWMAIWLLSLVFLPGCIAGFLQLYRGTKYSMFPNWLDQWMKARKQLGLLALMFAGMHACLSCLALAGDYVEHMQLPVIIPGTNQTVYHQLEWNGDVSLLFAVLAFTLLVVLGITSLPSVNQSMSWKEWNFVQSGLGYTALFFAFSHVLMYGFNIYNPATFVFFKNKMPPPIFLMPLFPGLVLLLKLVLMMPGVNGRLTRIREGWERRASNNDLAKNV